jgi:NAD(P)-dependent dehydrogenase (short-subunit alcohol dehydrogenase family)
MLVARGGGDLQKGLAMTVSKYPIGRLGTPEEIAAGVVYLASDEAAYVTGQTLHINGGMAMI